jgi:hypothetical protein
MRILKENTSNNLPNNMYIAFIGITATVFTSASAMFGYASGCLINLYLLLFCSLTVTEFLPFIMLITFLTNAVSLGFGFKTHLEEATSEQMFVNYDLIKIILPVLFLGLKVGMILNLTLSNVILVISSFLIIILTTILVIKR